MIRTSAGQPFTLTMDHTLNSRRADHLVKRVISAVVAQGFTRDSVILSIRRSQFKILNYSGFVYDHLPNCT